VSGAYSQLITIPDGSIDVETVTHSEFRKVSPSKLTSGHRPVVAKQSQKPLESHVWPTPQQVVPPHRGLPSEQEAAEEVDEIAEDVVEEHSEVDEDFVGRCDDGYGGRDDGRDDGWDDG
jgi:hypothetical protein